MTGGVGLGRRALDQVSPFHLAVDRDGRVVQVGPSLHRAAPAVRPGRRLEEVATADQDRFGRGHPGAGGGPGELVVLRITGTDLALRGHVVQDGEHRLFIGSPWLTDLAQLSALGLTVSDFAVSDPVLDHLLLQQTQRHALGQARDLASRLRDAAEELRHRAAYDELTGLVNRAALGELLQGWDGTGPDAPAAPMTVLLLDLDDFKDVNGGLGHEVGDAVLREVARRLVAAVPPSATVARLGGDEFVVVLGDGTDADAAVATGEALVRAVAAPLLVAGSELCVGSAVGIAVRGPDGGGEPGRVLLRQADLALYRAKASGAACAVHGAGEDDVAAERVGLVAALRAALAADALRVAYQPVVDPRDGRTVAFEALARWDDPVRGAVPPDRFVPVAEQSGLIVPLTRSVLRRAATDCRGWRAAGHDVGVAVNLSVDAFRRTDVAGMVEAALARAGLAAEHLTIEITEGSLVDDSPSLRDALAALRALGVTLSIDDFGTGFSSMSYLKRLPVQVLKIDRSFVADIDEDPRDRAIVGTLVRLAHGLGMTVVAEGVETATGVRLLASMGCDLAQGYALSRPLPAAQVLPWLAAEEGRTRSGSTDGQPGGPGASELVRA